MTTEHDYPSLPKRGENLAKFTWDVIKHAMANQQDFFVSEEVLTKRLKICQGCEWYDIGPHMCKHCGCPLEMKAKISIESCPIGAWSEHTDDWMNGKFDKIAKEIEDSQNP